MACRAVTESGKRQFELVVNSLKVKVGCSDWQTFADWLSAKTHMKISKDKIYRAAVGNTGLSHRGNP